MTISEGMVLQRALRQRMADLQSIRNSNAIRTRRWELLSTGAERERIETEPQYDAKKVDAKIVELESFLFKLDASIKQANAKTEIGIVADLDRLLAPIQ